MTAQQFYVYVHRRASDKQIFYIGKGIVKNRRAYHVGVHRSAHWRRVAAKHGRIVEIYSYWGTNEEACAEEIKLITFFREMGCPLVNKTDGGEGNLGWNPSLATREKFRYYGKQRTGASANRSIPTIIEFNSGKTITFSTGREAAKYVGVNACTLCDWIKGRYSPETKRNIKRVYQAKKGENN